MSRDIKLALQEHKQKVLDELNLAESQILGIFLYGSQNYELDTENSDVDTIAIVLPTEYDLYFSKLITKELHLDNGEHCVVKDIREIFKEFKKQNVNFLEIIFTQYNWLNELYEEKWHMFTSVWGNSIAHYDMNRAVKSICGQAKHTLRQALKEEEVDGKKMANALKMFFYLDKYIKGYYFSDCIVPTSLEKENIMAFKLGKVQVTKENVEHLIKIFEEKEKSEVINMPLVVTQSYLNRSLERIAFDFCKISVRQNPFECKLESH